MTIKVPISVPDPILRSNGSRGNNWLARQKRRDQRKEACDAARARMACEGISPPRWVRASYYIHAHLKRDWDEDNLISALKGAFDGLRDAWVIADDRGLRHVGTKMVRAQGTPFIILELAGAGEETA